MSQNPFWQPPATEDVITGIEQLRAKHPSTVTITIPLKLRTTRLKEQLLKVTQQRFTDMKAEILDLFQKDLEHINSKTSSEKLVSAIIELFLRGSQANSTEILQQLHQELSSLEQKDIPLSLPVNLIKAIADAIPSRSAGISLLQSYLDRWISENPDKQFENAITHAKEAKKIDENKKEVLRYNTVQIEQIRYAILLRKALQSEHFIQVQARTITSLAELAELNYHDLTRVKQIDEEINKRSVGQVGENIIELLCVAAERNTAGENTQTETHSLRDSLRSILKESQIYLQSKQKIEDSSYQTLPFIRRIIHILAAQSKLGAVEDRSIDWFRNHLEVWYATQSEQKQNILSGKMQIEHNESHIQHIRYATILNAYIENVQSISTDVLVLIELAEAFIRQTGDGSKLLYGILSRCYNNVCSKFKYPLSAVLRQAVFSKCAEGLLGWCQLVINYQEEQDLLSPKERNRTHQTTETGDSHQADVFRGKRVIQIPLIYTMWKAQEAAYRAAAATIVPIGPDVGKTLGNHGRASQRGLRRRRTTVLDDRFVGKRGARRLKKWLLKPEVVATTLEHLEVLAYPKLFPEARLDIAKAAPHPYWIKKRQQGRSVKAIRPSQFRHRSASRPVRLGQLTSPQRDLLRNQLRELQAYGPQFEKIQQAVDQFIDPAPPAYPSIDRVLYTEQEVALLPFEMQLSVLEFYEQLKRKYEQDLDVLRDFRPARGEPFEDFPPEKLYDIETIRAQSLEQSAAVLLPAQLQPISFHRTMNYDLKPKSFTLLVSDHNRNGSISEKYVFVCDFFGEDAPEKSIIEQRSRSDSTSDQEFLNYPGHYISNHDDTSLLFFAVEIGDDYQGAILRELRERQRRTPRKCKADCKFAETGTHLQGCVPKEGAITTATITNRVNGRGHQEWFAHLPVPISTSPCLARPNAVTGFHEREGKFYFATINLQGQFLDAGEVIVPSHVDTHTLRGNTSKNFAYEVAWNIVRQIRNEQYISCIGIEDTSWKRESVDISAERNRQLFAFPYERIVAIAQLKIAQEGMIPLTQIRGVAPSRDCGYCGERLKSGSNIRLRPTRYCPNCDLRGQRSKLELIEDLDTTSYQCSGCQRVWPTEVPQFKCHKCGRQQYAPYNTALVVARQLLVKLSKIKLPEKTIDTDT